MNKDDLFEQYISESMDELPEDYIKNLNNVAIVTEDTPDGHQQKSVGLREGSLLLGLYEGIPLTRRGTGSIMALPDKITLFKDSIVHISKDEKHLKANIKRTLWHEIAHYYGLNHDDMNRLQHVH